MPLIRKIWFTIGGVRVECPLKYFSGASPGYRRAGSNGYFVVELPEKVVSLLNKNWIRKGETSESELEAERLAGEAVKAYNKAVEVEEKVIMYDLEDASDCRSTIGQTDVFWHGLKIRWRIASRFNLADGYEYLDEFGKRSPRHDEYVMLWTQEREDFFTMLCEQLERMTKGANDFLNENECAARIDALMPKLAGGSIMPLLEQ